MNATILQYTNDLPWALLGSTLACGLSVGFLFGPTAGAIAALVHVALNQLNDRSAEGERSWYPAKRSFEEVKGYWDGTIPLYTIQFIVGLVAKIILGGIAFSQRAIQFIQESFASPFATVYALFRVAAVAPFVEETIFRGFLQDGLRSVQIYFFGKKRADENTYMIMRVAFQAILFGLAHFHPSQGLANIAIVLLTGSAGAVMGFMREYTDSLWCSTACHAHVNSAFFFRLWLFGT